MKSYPEVTFKNRAHQIPNSLGAKKITRFECDNCNSLFGHATKTDRSIEHTFKEAFNITRHILFQYSKSKGTAPKYTSTYFKIKDRKISLKTEYKLIPGFQRSLAKQFKKGIYKVALEFLIEELELGFEKEFDQIREFVLNDGNQLPVFYHKRKVGAIFTSEESIRKPILYPVEEWKELLFKTKFFQFEILHHRFSIPLGDAYDEIGLSKRVDKFYDQPRIIEFFNDLDLTIEALTKR